MKRYGPVKHPTFNDFLKDLQVRARKSDIEVKVSYEHTESGDYPGDNYDLFSVTWTYDHLPCKNKVVAHKVVEGHRIEKADHDDIEEVIKNNVEYVRNRLRTSGNKTCLVIDNSDSDLYLVLKVRKYKREVLFPGSEIESIANS